MRLLVSFAHDLDWSEEASSRGAHIFRSEFEERRRRGSLPESFVPGMGTIHGFLASSHPRATCAGVAFFALGKLGDHVDERFDWPCGFPRSAASNPTPRRPQDENRRASGFDLQRSLSMGIQERQ